MRPYDMFPRHNTLPRNRLLLCLASAQIGTLGEGELPMSECRERMPSPDGRDHICGEELRHGGVHVCGDPGCGHSWNAPKPSAAMFLSVLRDAGIEATEYRRGP